MLPGVQQFVFNHQGQQLVLQRAGSGVSTVTQPQNIILRTGTPQSGIVHLQQNTQPQALEQSTYVET